jgi:hypothetical protein
MVMQLSGFDKIIAPITIHNSRRKNVQTTADGKPFNAQIKGESISFGLEDGKELKFDLGDAVRKAAELNWKRGVTDSKTKRAPLRVKEKNGGESELLIVEMRGTFRGSQTVLRFLRAWLLIKTN